MKSTSTPCSKVLKWFALKIGCQDSSCQDSSPSNVSQGDMADLLHETMIIKQYKNIKTTYYWSCVNLSFNRDRVTKITTYISNPIHSFIWIELLIHFLIFVVV